MPFVNKKRTKVRVTKKSRTRNMGKGAPARGRKGKKKGYFG